MYVLVSLMAIGTPDFEWTIHKSFKHLKECVELQEDNKFCIHAGRAYFYFDTKPVRKDLE